jgi:phosphatidylserine decarboxylase
VAGGLAAVFEHPLAAGLLFAVTLFLVQFFRDPDRIPEGGSETIVSPADGTVLSVTEPPEAPPGAKRRLSIFMSVFNCHVNRAPAEGRIDDFVHVPGKKLAAFDDKASTDNEQTRVTLSAPQGRLAFKQIAGALARRIVFYPAVGQELARGERIGIIKFGSRVDVFLPDDCELLVGKGQKLKAGMSGIARWRGGA